MRRIALAALALFLGTVGAAQAHTPGAIGAGLAEGFAHPMFGLDHVLAMVAVGLWAAQLGGRAVWQVPLSFMAMMAVGGAAGLAGFDLPAIEIGILGSLLALGALVATAARLPTGLGAALVGFFAFFHGFAHGAEMPEAASAALYALGFVAATGLLHGIGVVLGLSLQSRTAAWIVRAGGAGVAATGLVLLML
jgi:urease accessory protein